MMIKSVKHVCIPVRNQDEALSFYTKKLGFELLCDVPMGQGMRWIELKIPHADTQVVLFTPDGQQDRIGTFSNIVFKTDDVQKSYEELLKKGVEFSRPPQKEDWGSYALFKDADGNEFCLSSS